MQGFQSLFQAWHYLIVACALCTRLIVSALILV